MTRLLPLITLALAACGDSTGPTLTGVVLDHWGEPLEGATVAVDGSNDRPLTDSDGVFSLPRGAGTLKLKAGKDGYIQDHLEVEIPESGDVERITFKLWQEPKETGFFVVGTAGYKKIEPVPVQIVGTGSSTVQGLPNIGQVRAEGSLEVLFHTELREHEIAKFDLELHGLELIKSAEVVSVEGPTTVDVNMFSSTGKVDMKLEPLRSKHDYLVTAEGLEPGFYAFSAMQLLTMADAEKFAQIPKDLRVAHPFELK